MSTPTFTRAAGQRKRLSYSAHRRINLRYEYRDFSTLLDAIFWIGNCHGYIIHRDRKVWSK